MKELQRIIASIVPVDRAIEPEVQAHLNNLTKPQGSLGVLEDIALRYCLATQSVRPAIGKKRILTFAADHGVVAEGVSAYPKEVTSQMVRNMLAGGAAVNVLTRHVGAEVRVIDIGVDDLMLNAPGLCQEKVKSGTANMAQGPAMSIEEALQAVHVGIDYAFAAAEDGVTLLGTGDMGIGNTTASSALYSILLPCTVEEITGRGTGIDDAGLTKKIQTIKKALLKNKDQLHDPLSCLAAVGGLEIAGICGCILGAAARRVPIVIDGFISSAAALVACALCPFVKEYLFFSHRSDERGHAAFFKLFGVWPILDLKMRLGEGTGAALAIFMIEAALKIYNEMSSFESAKVSGKHA